jgi:hypothetical protein
MAPQEISHLQSLLAAYHREKDLIRRNFENRQETIRQAIVATRNGDEAANLFRQLRSLDQEMDGEMQRIYLKIEETTREINRMRL